MSQDGSGDAPVIVLQAQPEFLDINYVEEEEEEEEEDDPGLDIDMHFPESSINDIGIFIIYLLYDCMLFLGLFLSCLIFMQICTIFSSVGLDVYQKAPNYFKALYVLTVLKILHCYLDEHYHFVNRIFAERFQNSPMYKHFPTCISTGLLALSYVKVVHEYYEMKSNIQAQQSYYANGVKYVICVFYINYFNLCQSVRDWRKPTRISSLILRFFVFAASLLIIGQLGKYQFPETDPIVITQLPFLDYFWMISFATILVVLGFVVAVKYSVVGYELRLGNKLQELVWTMCMSHVLIHCFLETEAFLGLESETIEQVADLRFWAAMFYSVLVTQITLIA